MVHTHIQSSKMASYSKNQLSAGVARQLLSWFERRHMLSVMLPRLFMPAFYSEPSTECGDHHHFRRKRRVEERFRQQKRKIKVFVWINSMDLLQSFAHPSEIWALFRFKFGGGKETVMPTLHHVSLLGTNVSSTQWSRKVTSFDPSSTNLSV